MSLKGGTVCAYRGCSSKTGKGISLFHFPRDAERAVLWLRACLREDLLGKNGETLSKNYLLCEEHFDSKWISESGISRKRLSYDAVPTLFPHLLECGTVPAKSEEQKKKVVILSDILLEAPAEQCDTNMIISRPASPLPGTSGIRDIEPGATSYKLTSPMLSPVSTQTPAALSSKTPRKQKLRKMVDILRKTKSTKKVLPQSEEDWTINDFHNMCDKFLSKPLAEIVKSQSVLKGRKPVGRRYSQEYKRFAITLYFLGPRAYKFMQKLICLPTKRSLERMTQKLVCKPGLQNEAIFKALDIKVNTMLSQDKHCLLCIDEKAIKANLYYHTGRDEIVGLHDVGSGEKKFLMAHNALVIMIRGLYSNWKQPIAYFFVNTQFEANELVLVIKECIRKLTQCGLLVDALVNDLGSNFIELANILGVTADEPQFEVDGQNIIYLFDTCHLIKSTRNNLMKNVLCFDGKKTSWSYIEYFYQRDKSQFYRSAPKLTDSHIHPTNFEKMKVKLATQVLSHTVASGMNTYMALGALSGEALGTIEVIEKFNNLFDLLNSSCKDTINPLKNIFEGNEIQLNYLNEMADFIKKIKIYSTEGKDVTSWSKFKPSWIITINGIKRLWNRLSASNFKYLITRRINQDAIENFFGSIRQQGGNCINPSAIQFERAFRKLFYQNYLHSTGMNCIEDHDELLANISQFDCSDTDVDKEIETKAISLPDYEYKNENIPTQNAFVYVCGYLIRKALKVHRCVICEKLSKDSDKLDIDKLFIYFKAYDTNKSIYGGLRVPSERFINYVYVLEQIFSSTFEEICRRQRISQTYLEKMKEVQYCHPCTKFPLEYIIKLFIRLRIFYTVKYANQDFKASKKGKKNRKISILSHI